jgi:hypothetical protein
MARETAKPERRLPWYGWIGAGGLLAGEVALFRHVSWVETLFYCIAWWSYILLADAWVWRRRGHSLLRNRPWEFLVLAFWSIALWNLFELLNFRLENWCYINVPRDPIQGGILSFLAYATVVPGLFETYDLVCVNRVFERMRIRPRRIRPAGLGIAFALGLFMLAACLGWPQHAYPLVWGFAVFLLDPLCYLAGGRSILRQLEQGNPRPFLRLLLAGLICGGLWEFWNFWAYTKWLYTVPFFERLKWFEMPPLGFLGFPPFTVESYVLINTLELFRRGRSWEGPAVIGAGAGRGLAVAAAVAAMVFNLGVYAGIERFTVVSYAPTLADLDGLPPDAVSRLSAVGVHTPPELRRRTATAEALTRLVQQAHLAESDLTDVREAARLADLKGLGAPNRNALRLLGIQRVEDLANQDPDSLAARWQRLTTRAPSLAQLRIWVIAARHQRPVSSKQ